MKSKHEEPGQQRQSHLCFIFRFLLPFFRICFMAIHPDMLEQARRFHQAGQLAEADENADNYEFFAEGAE
jgi:hypothetical protein